MCDSEKRQAHFGMALICDAVGWNDINSTGGKLLQLQPTGKAPSYRGRRICSTSFVLWCSKGTQDNGDNGAIAFFQDAFNL